MDELSKTYTLAHSPEGWRVHFADEIASVFRVERHYSVFEVIDRVETLYPEYRPRLTIKQLADYEIELTRRGHAQELQKIISHASDLKDGLIDLTKKLPQIGASQDREIAEDLRTLHHQLSDLRAHVDIARREVVLAKRVGLSEKAMGRNGQCSRTTQRIMIGIPGARTAKPRAIAR